MISINGAPIIRRIPAGIHYFDEAPWCGSIGEPVGDVNIVALKSSVTAGSAGCAPAVKKAAPDKRVESQDRLASLCSFGLAPSQDTPEKPLRLVDDKVVEDLDLPGEIPFLGFGDQEPVAFLF